MKGGSVAARLVWRLIARSQFTAGRIDRALRELALALHEPSLERLSVVQHYDGSPSYLNNQHAGFFPFERRALDRYFPLPPARVLVPGMGGGREVVALLEAGYQVEGFDPAETLVNAARGATSAWPQARVETLSLQQFSRNPAGRFDAVFGGWGMWAHLVSQADRLAALRAFREVCPAGPVLLSFWRGERSGDHEERTVPLEPLHPAPATRLRRIIHGVVRERLLGRLPVERGSGFANGVFYHLTTEAELLEEASASGWRVAHYERDGARYPNAVLVPR